MNLFRSPIRSERLGLNAALVALFLAPVSASHEALTFCPASHAPLVVYNATLVDPEAGVVPDAEIHLVDGRVAWQGRRGERAIPAKARRLDLRGAFLLPGLVDAHAHFGYIGQEPPERYRNSLGTAIVPLAGAQLLRAGITSARDPYFPAHRAPDFARAACQDDYPAPRFDYAAIVFVGGILPAQEGPMARSAVDRKSVIAHLDAVGHTGGGWVKLLNVDQIFPDTLQFLVEQAHARGLRVAAHGLTVGEAVSAVWAGVDSVEHIAVTEDAGFPDTLLERLRASEKPYWIPTAAAEFHALDTIEKPELLAQHGLTELMPGDLAEALLRAARSQKVEGWLLRQQSARATVDGKFKQLAATLDEHMLIGSESGTTNSFPVQSIWLEIRYWREQGIDPMRILRAVTSGPAKLLASSEIGSLAAGKRADLVVLKRNPLTEPVDFADVTTVIKGGHVFVENGRWVGPVPQPEFQD